MSEKLTHFDEQGNAIMVDVGDKPATKREAVAIGVVKMRPETLKRILDDQIEKGDTLNVARLAGIMAAKKTPDLVPLCHPLALSSVRIDFHAETTLGELEIRATVGVTGATGVEMEAMTAVSVAALTVYDMCKAVDRSMTLDDIRLLEKKGGKSGAWNRPE
ncbi:MAG: cyclic pyranopterin monophosphate synthase MoaC [Desulfuromonadales bacterium]|nr:cyclic pyranopterin monophosphate synthase MoaC [Desulfuromonadales bacterium]NIS42688.1 cyclic pyranopterin monophosphate synthase MoaC [Desulfuromonadales bacterium]